jgi:endogenous inhibitor of DNA gyrase (YacG/DUF329 family)
MQRSDPGWRFGRVLLGSLGVLAVLAATWVQAPRLGADEAKGGAGGGVPGGLVVEYTRTGVVPGSEETSTARQRLTVNEDGTRLCFEDFPERAQGKKYILHADEKPPAIYEIFPDGKSFSRHTGDLVKVQQTRLLTELNEIKLARSMKKKDEQEFFREFPWLRADGRRVAEVKRTPGKVILGKPCDHIVVTENGRTIIAGEVTKDAPPGAKNYYKFYRRLGAFSDEVLEKLEGLEGVLLSGKIKVVTATIATDFMLEATSLKVTDVDPSLFDVSGMTEVQATPTSSTCPICGKTVNPKRATKAFYPKEGRLYFCSEKCADVRKARDLKKRTKE